MEKLVDIIKEHDNSIISSEMVRKKLSRFEDKDIIDCIGMAEMPKIVYYLETKHNAEYKLTTIENDVIISVNNLNIANISYLPVYIHFIQVNDQVIEIEGSISMLPRCNSYNFVVSANDIEQECQFTNCNMDYSIGDNIVERKDVFKVKIKLEDLPIKIDFYNRVNETDCSINRLNFYRFAPINDAIKSQYCVRGDYLIYTDSKSIFVEKVNNELAEEKERIFQNELAKLNTDASKKAIKLREQYFNKLKQKTKPIWVVMDRTNRADDNGEIFFRYIQSKKDIDSYFIISDSCDDYYRLKKIGKTVPLYSDEHLVLIMLADFIISSQCNGVVENPFWENAEFYRDLYHQAKIVFLQHGVIKDDMSKTLNRFHTNFTGFITSTNDEYKSIIEYPYFYEEKNVWLTGLPVMDTLKNRSSRLIVFAPTWRMNLMHQEWDEAKKEMKWIPSCDIKASEYYQRLRSIFQNEKLRKYCKRRGYKLAFKPHPLMEEYLKDITRDTDVIFLSQRYSYKDVLCKAKVLISDYSSLQFEFAYLGKSTIYYQYDQDIFFENHTYKKGYFDYEKDGFGPVERNEEELIEQICKYIKHWCYPGSKYKKRIKSVYKYKGHSCKKIYKKILSY